MKNQKVKKINILLIFVCCFIAAVFAVPKISQAASPEVLFSDLTDGPTSGWEQSSTKGAAVTIWGRNFGTSRGSSYVSIGGINLTSDSDYAEWGAENHDSVTAGNPIVPIGLQRITFFLNSSMALGATTISITTNNGTSSTIPFYCRALGSNHIYFFSTSGSDSNNGLYASQGTGSNGPKQTTKWARINLQAGDVAYFRAGTWTAYDLDDDTGLSNGIFTFVLSNHHNGTANNSITIASYPGETAQLGAAKGLGMSGTAHSLNFPGATGGLVNYWTISKFKMEARVSVWNENIGPGFGSDHMRIIGNDWSTSYDVEDVAGNGDGIELQGGGQGKNNLTVYGNYCHDIGVDYRGQTSPRRVYCMYIGGYGALNNIYIGWNEFGWNTAGRGFQVYGHTCNDTLDNFYFFNNYVHNVSRQGVILGGGEGCASSYTFARTAYVYNNILSTPGAGDEVAVIGGGQGPTDTYGSGGTFYFYNNILYQPANYPAYSIARGTYTLKNNIIYNGPNAYNYYTGECGDEATCIGDHNLYYGAGANKKPAWDSSVLDNTNPQFINSNPLIFSDFNLQSTSPAINAGNSSVSSVVNKDFLGLSRPQGAGYDIGAYEYDEGTVLDTNAPGAPHGLSVH